MFPFEPPDLVLFPSVPQREPRAMAKKKDDRKGKGKASSDEQASPERTSGKQKGSYGASILPIRLTHAPREMVVFTHFVPR